jgi:hypothetical protein
MADMLCWRAAVVRDETVLVPEDEFPELEEQTPVLTQENIVSSLEASDTARSIESVVPETKK